VRFFSPAKINLFLNVLKKRGDGYHAIETLFERLDFGDTVYLDRTSSRIELEILGREKVPNDSKNLAWRAARLLQETCRVRQGVRIRIRKRIPVSAGLGGGSSNAATVLLGLNRLWNLGLPRKKLMVLGSKLGSDVPFFILEAPWAFGRGRGEILKPVAVPAKKIWHVLIKPSFGISTKDAYQGFVPGLTPKKANVKMLLHSIHRGDSEALSKLLFNSLELTLNKRVKIILKIKKQLVDRGAYAALMSGSGSCVFGLFGSKQKARHAARRLKSGHKKWQIFTASTY
jgi:4-diphosphocytidyl-2-C-methyl-D-erythritol kinase